MAAEQKVAAGPVVFRYEPLIVVQGAADYSEADQLTYLVKGRPAFAFVDIYLKKGQKVLANAGAMIWMDGDVQVETGCFGGCGAAFYRTCSGESCCQNMFFNVANDLMSKATFGFEYPGDMLPFAVTPGNGWILTRKAFVVGSEFLEVSSRFSGCAACLCSGEGAFLTMVTVPPEAANKKGMFFAGSYGSLERHEIPAGKIFYVDTGLFFAAHEGTHIDIGLAGGCCTCICGGEGFVMQFHGPCVLYTKSRNPAIFDRWETHGSKRHRQAGAGAGQGAAVAVR